MEDFQNAGSANACAVLKALGFDDMYLDTCINGRATEAYAQAGWIFWAAFFLIIALTLYSLRRAVSYAFS